MSIGHAVLAQAEEDIVWLIAGDVPCIRSGAPSGISAGGAQRTYPE